MMPRLYLELWFGLWRALWTPWSALPFGIYTTQPKPGERRAVNDSCAHETIAARAMTAPIDQSIQNCLITGAPAGSPEGCGDCDPCIDPRCWESERPGAEVVQLFRDHGGL